MMKRHQYFQVVTGIFSLVALTHVLRLVYGWSAVIAGWEVPTWLSVVAVGMAGYLAYQGYAFSQKK